MLKLPLSPKQQSDQDVSFSERNVATARLRTVRSLSSSATCAALTACSFVSQVAVATYHTMIRRKTADSEEKKASQTENSSSEVAQYHNQKNLPVQND